MTTLVKMPSVRIISVEIFLCLILVLVIENLRLIDGRATPFLQEELLHSYVKNPNEVEDDGRWGTTRPSVTTRCGATFVAVEAGHVSGACPEAYSAHASEDVGQTPEPSQPGPEYSTQELEEAVYEME
ncbi:hypothetical protein HOLleu_41430 [Holothuria leucospilota]|uniref:Uncharacterized protein n=1 Tax=Holothuria leucospilota TaxID=206669 RepID=A0A9Q1BAQ1_HOLLE|nr:hypothetical protein HOLleu_41430 [Holothuria leucospilota]